jgi:Flp pilus assembly secretin CpaC
MGRYAMGQEKLLAGLRAFALSLALLLSPIAVGRASDDTITLALGTGSIFRLERAFATVLIGDPSVVDVRAQDDRSVVLQALGLGSSNIVFVDAQNIAIANIRVVVRDTQI